MGKSRNNHTKDTIVLFIGLALARPRKAVTLEAQQGWTQLPERC